MTPLEKAKQKLSLSKSYPSCVECHRSERVGNLLYCQISGKIIMPQYENISCCRGERLKE